MLKKFNLVLLLIAVFLFSCCVQLQADTLYLKNGREAVGIIKNENERIVDLEVCSGAVQFTKSEIEKIEKSTPEELELMRQKCLKASIQNQKRLLRQQAENKTDVGEAEFSGESQIIIINTILNKKVKTALVLDTGASLVMLRKNIAEKLGIGPDKLKSDMEIQLADGSKAKAKYIILDSIEVQDKEAKNVEAAILLDDVKGADFKDGLLGRSFLKKFNFKVDYKNKKLTLEQL